MSGVVVHTPSFILWEYIKDDTQLLDIRGGGHENFDVGGDQLHEELVELPLDELYSEIMHFLMVRNGGMKMIHLVLDGKL